MDTSGIISTLAGTGTGGFGGDGGSPTSALLGYPVGLAVDGSGNVYIADLWNDRIRRVLIAGRPPVPGTPDPPDTTDPPDPPNSPPQVLVALEDVNLADGQTTRTDLDPAFQDVDGDVLTYSAVSSAPGVVLASVEGSELVLSGVSAGVATVTVSATDPHGLRAQQTLAVTVGTVLSLDGDGAAAEGGMARLSVRLSSARQVATAFSWKVLEDDDPATADADAGANGNASGDGSIAAGETAATIRFAIRDDADVEPPREWFLVELMADAGDSVTLGRSRASVAVLEGVCDRGAAVAAALAGGRGCEAPTAADLAGVRRLQLERRGIETLGVNDLAGLVGLRTLWLHGNALTTLPEDAFAGLGQLRELNLADNALAALPDGLLEGLSELHLLRLDGNALATLPDGLFSGVASLRSVRLEDNPGAPFVLRVGLRRRDAQPSAAAPATIQATLATGAPFAVALSLTASGGGFQSADGSMPETTSVPLAAGETATQHLVVAAPVAVPVRVSLSVGPVPETICEGQRCWQGLALAAGDPLVLFAAPPTAVDISPEPLFGEDLRLPLASLVAAGDLPVERWQAASSNPSVATVRLEGDELVVAPEPGAEGAVEVEVMATDAAGQSVSVRFQVRVDFHRLGSPPWRHAL